MSRISLKDFVLERESGRKIHSRHFDELLLSASQWECLDDIMVIASEIISNIVSINEALNCHLRLVCISIPISSSEHICPYDIKIISKLIDQFEPPSVYISDKDDLFGEEFEEYRIPIINFQSIQHLKSKGVNIIFRSFRSQLAISENWEFSNGIFLLKHL